jgi:hypothetical protein
VRTRGVSPETPSAVQRIHRPRHRTTDNASGFLLFAAFIQCSTRPGMIGAPPPQARHGRRFQQGTRRQAALRCRRAQRVRPIPKQRGRCKGLSADKNTVTDERARQAKSRRRWVLGQVVGIERALNPRYAITCRPAGRIGDGKVACLSRSPATHRRAGSRPSASPCSRDAVWEVKGDGHEFMRFPFWSVDDLGAARLAQHGLRGRGEQGHTAGQA